MKIGKFAEVNKVTVDSVRHYMDLGLILPNKQGGQYFFDEKCVKDLKDILNLKAMGFSLNEIKAMFMFKSFGKLTPYQENEYYKAFFIDKQKYVEEKIHELVSVEKTLKEKIRELSEKSSIVTKKIGINFKNLDLLKCLKCKNELVLSNGIVTNNQVIEGILKCSCGEEYIIEDGILVVNKINNEELHGKYNLNYIKEYVSDTDISYLDSFYKGLEWINKKINFGDFKGKTLLELGSGIGFFLRYVCDELPKDCVYIAVDHDIERHKFLKNVFQQVQGDRNILFICSDFLQIPIEDKSIDIMLDFSGTSNYSFKHEEFLLELIDKYAKSDARLIGTYLLFKNFSLESLIEQKYRKNFNLKTVKDKIKELKYNAIDEKTSGYIDKGGKYESYFVEGEKIFTYTFIGKR
ncbi:MerR family transcriptional regulator [Clostridium sp.]|uniref:MerR family transcriptional regulator n=1 Tax=Clostridium sp. TaxID=1506 RepID=UPI002FC69EAF